MERIKDYRKVFSVPITKSSLYKITNTILLYPEDFKKTFQLIADPEKEISWRAAWACQKAIEQNPQFFDKKQDDFIAFAMQTPHSGTKRCLLAILLDQINPEPLSIKFLDFCFSHMLDTNEAVAVQALCIKLAYKLCVHEPELLSELSLYLTHANLEYYTPAVRSCIKNIRKKIN